jgi:hypothetical protein
MIETSLPSPNIGGKGHHLRRIAAQAISYIEMNAPNYTGAVGVAGRHPSADELKAFFDACSTAVAPFVMGTPVTGETGT